jgi:uncharacterized repeat protein (TIGR03843 family)
MGSRDRRERRRSRGPEGEAGRGDGGDARGGGDVSEPDGAPAFSQPVLTDAEALDLMARGEVSVKGRMPWSSNATFLVEIALDGVAALAVYKPGRGERPLWDFPRSLYRREVAAYLLSEALGWGLVPPTLEREGPLGDGSLQYFVVADFEQHYFSLRDDPKNRERLQRICLFDLVANNADRKGGHCLLGVDGVIRAIDHGLCFHVEPKLRTVIWDFAGEPIDAAMLDELRRVPDLSVPDRLADLLHGDELEALVARARAVVRRGRFPEPRGHAYPWPLV